MSKLITEDEKLEVIKITAGNDFSLNITVTELQDAETGVWSVLDLNAATDVNLYLVNSNGKRIKLDHTINSTGSLLADVIAGYLQTTTYGVTIEFKLNGRNRRTFSPCLIQLVNSTEEAGTTLAEYVNDVYNLNIRVLSDVALIKMGGSSVIPQDDMVTLAYLEANYYDKNAIDDNYYDMREITNLLSYCITETDLQDALEQFESTISGEFIDTQELDEALSYYALTDDIEENFATKSYVNEQIAAIPETDLSDYITYSYLDSKNLASEAYVNEKISEIPQTDLSNYTTYSYINSRGFMTESRLNDLGYLRQGDISAMSYATTNYVDTKITSIDIPDVSNLVSQSSLETQLQPYVTQSQINSASYASTQYVENVTADMATKSYVTQKISEIPGVDLSSYATKSYVDEKINAIDFSSYITHNELDSMSYVVHDELAGFATQAYVDTKVDGLVSYTALNNMSYLTTGDAYDLYATKSYVTEHVDGLVSYAALEDMSYISTYDLDIETVVTTDTEQDITGPKTFTSESTFNNLNYNLEYGDNAEGVAKTSMFARGSMNQAIIGQIIAPCTSYTDNLQSTHNTAYEIVFERISSVDATAPTLVQMAKITSGGIVEQGEYLSSKYTSYAYVDARLSAIDTSNYVSYDFLSSQSYVTSNDLSNYATQSYVDTKVDGLASYASISEMSYVQQSALDTTLAGYVTTSTAQTIPVTKTFNYGASSLTDIAGQEQRSITVGRSVTNQTITGQIIAPLLSASDGTGGVNIQNEIVCYAAPNGTTLQMTQLGKFTTQGIYEGTQKLSDKYASFNYVDQAINSVRANGVMLASNSPVNASYIWTGTNAELALIQSRDPGTLYITTDDEAQQIDLTPYQTKSEAASYYVTYAYLESKNIPTIVVCTQAEYNSYVSGGTVDASTIYMIKEV